MLKQIRTFFLVAIIAIAGISFFIPKHVSADLDDLNRPPENEFFKAEVIEIWDIEDDIFEPFQRIKVKALEGQHSGEELEVIQESIKGYRTIKHISAGETVIVYKDILNEPEFTIESKYRLPQILWLTLFFFVLTVFFTGKKGVRALLGLVLNILIMIYFVVPQIAHGSNPILISIVASLAMLIISMYLSHGIHRRSTIAFLSSLLAIVGAGIFGWLSIWFTKLSGVGTESGFYLQFGNLSEINLQGLLLGGIIISTIGLIDDVSIVQASTVEELHKANKKLSKKELYARGLVVGKEHIISMVNTLFIVYAGAALPLFLFFNFSEFTGIPLWVYINGQAINEEIVRSLVGSAILICTVPLTTLFAAHVYAKESEPKEIS